MALSDIHAGPDNLSASLVPPDDRIQDGLDDLRAEGLLDMLPVLRPDIIVVAGDITQSATVGQFETALKFLKRACERAGLDASRLVIVPGNHDTDFSATKPFLGKKVEREHRKELRYWPLKSAAMRLHPTLDVGLLDGRHYGIQDAGSTRFLLLNTAGHAMPDDPIPAGLVSDETLAQIRDDPRWVADPKPGLRVGVLHHHLTSFDGRKPFDVSAVQNNAELVRLMEELGIDLAIHGHKHVPRLDKVGSTRVIPTIGCGTFGGQPSGADPTITRNFHLIEVGPRPNPKAGAPGKITTYGWNFGPGWKPSRSPWIGDEDFFGAVTDVQTAAEMIERIMTGRDYMTELDFRNGDANLAWLPSRDLRDGMRIVGKRNGFKVTTEEETGLLTLVRKVHA